MKKIHIIILALILSVLGIMYFFIFVDEGEHYLDAVKLDYKPTEYVEITNEDLVKFPLLKEALQEHRVRTSLEEGLKVKNFIIWDKSIKHGDLLYTTNIKVNDEYYFITVSSVRYSFRQMGTI